MSCMTRVITPPPRSALMPIAGHRVRQRQHVGLARADQLRRTGDVRGHLEDVGLGRRPALPSATRDAPSRSTSFGRGAHDVHQLRQRRRRLVGGQVRRLAQVDHRAGEVDDAVGLHAELPGSLSDRRDLLVRRRQGARQPAQALLDLGSCAGVPLTVFVTPAQADSQSIAALTAMPRPATIAAPNPAAAGRPPAWPPLLAGRGLHRLLLLVVRPLRLAVLRDRDLGGVRGGLLRLDRGVGVPEQPNNDVLGERHARPSRYRQRVQLRG
jgi:hypothetical protein